MNYNQRSLRWHRRRAYAQMAYAHADQALEAGNNNEFVTAMHETNRADAAYGITKANKAFFGSQRHALLIEERKQRKNEKDS